MEKNNARWLEVTLIQLLTFDELIDFNRQSWNGYHSVKLLDIGDSR
jgi:hypothetical protein